MEDILEKIKMLNPERNITSVFDESFKKYGVIHSGFEISSLLEYLDQNEVGDEMFYTSDDPEMRRELTDQLEPVMNSIYAGMDVQVGKCYGRNNTLNALEFHHGSEVYINATDMILLLGLDENISWPEGTYDSSLVGAFYTPRGSVTELKGGCMHYGPANVFKSEGINVIVSLLNKTNTPVDFKKGKSGRDKLIIGKNTWLLAHPDFEPAKDAGWHLGIKGENFSIKAL